MSRVKNAQLGITGLLLYRDGDIMQALEGDEGRVRSLLATIGRDPRLHRLAVIREEYGGEPLFGNWTMGSRHLAAAAPAALEGLRDCMRRRDAGDLPAPARGAVIELLGQFRDAR